MGIVQSALRDFCNLVRDSLQHYMRVYQHVKSFWKELEKFICQNCENVRNFIFNETKLCRTNTNFKSDNILYFLILLKKYSSLPVVADMKKQQQQQQKTTTMHIQKGVEKKVQN